MTTKNKTQSAAVAAFLESILQNHSRGGGDLTGQALVDAIDPADIDPAVTAHYLELIAQAA